MNTPIFVDSEYDYDYFYDEEKRTHILKYSNSEVWYSTIREKTVLTAIDTGSGFKFSQKIGKKVDYSLAIQINILLNFMNDYINLEKGKLKSIKWKQ
jgi:hypothetical protein